MGRRLYLFLLALILALGVYLRLVDLGGPSLWHDEIIHLEVAESLAKQPWYRALTGVQEVRGYTENGLLYYLHQMLGQKWFPGEVGARLFPAFFGILALLSIALSGHLLGGRLVSLLATFLLAVSPLHVYYSREGRPYSLIILLALVLLHTLLAKGSKLGILLAYSGCLVAAYVGIHTVPILLSFLALSCVAMLWSRREGKPVFKSPVRHYLVAAIAALALVYGLYLTRSTTNTVDFEEIRSPVYISPLSERAAERFLASMTTSGHQSVLPGRRSWFLLGFAGVGLLAGCHRNLRDSVTTFGMFALPAGLSIVALVSVGRWYGLRYTCSALPAFLLLVALGVAASGEAVGRLVRKEGMDRARWILTGATAMLLILLLAAPNLIASQSDTYRKLDWRGVASFFAEVALEDEPIVVPNTWPQICLGYYLRQLGRVNPFYRIDESVAEGQALVETTPRGWLLTAGFRRTGEVRAWMHGFQPVLKKKEEELALFYYPSFSDLMKTRFAAGKGGVFERQFAANGRRFDFGGAELTLQGRGWSFHEENKEGIRYQWAMGEQAELGVPIGEPRDARIRFRALPFMAPEIPAQTVEVWLNESLLDTSDLPRGWSDHEIVAPTASWDAGANILFFRFSHSTIPAEAVPGSKDRRPLAAAFDYLELIDTTSP